MSKKGGFLGEAGQNGHSPLAVSQRGKMVSAHVVAAGQKGHLARRDDARDGAVRGFGGFGALGGL